MLDHYSECKDRLSELINESCLQQEKFFQHILLVSASILGIVAALHDTHEQCLCIRLVFVSSILLLGLGTLIIGIVVYNHSMLYERHRADFHAEFLSAVREERRVKDVRTGKKKWVICAEKASLIVLATGIFLLMLYVVLSSLHF